MCDNNIHNDLIENDEQICPFCNVLLLNNAKISYNCCDLQLLEDIDGIRVCINCGIVHECISKSDYYNFHENMFKILRKSIYFRKYHIKNFIDDLLYKNIVQLSVLQINKILKIFDLFDNIIDIINENRKRIISVKYLLKRIFDMMNIKYNIPITKSKRTLTFYNAYWEKIITVIGDKIKSIIDK